MPPRLWPTFLFVASAALTGGCARAATTPVSSQDYTAYGASRPAAESPLAHAPFFLAGQPGVAQGPFATLSSASTDAPPALIGFPAPAPAPPVELRPSAPAPSRPNTASIPGGDRCLELLQNLGIRHQVLDAKKGVVTPVELTSAIGGIEYTSPAGPMVADCRLLAALAWVAPELRSLGVTRVGFSGAYSYRMSRVGRLSLHAHGLALDVHEITARGSHSSVERDFARGLADGCNETSPVMNQLACRLKRLGAFKELLTPDYDADHSNHLHLAIAPLSVPTSSPSPTLPDELIPRKRAIACERRPVPPSSGRTERGCAPKTRGAGLNRKASRASVSR